MVRAASHLTLARPANRDQARGSFYDFPPNYPLLRATVRCAEGVRVRKSACGCESLRQIRHRRVHRLSHLADNNAHISDRFKCLRPPGNRQSTCILGDRGRPASPVVSTRLRSSARLARGRIAPLGASARDSVRASARLARRRVRSGRQGCPAAGQCGGSAGRTSLRWASGCRRRMGHPACGSVETGA